MGGFNDLRFHGILARVGKDKFLIGVEGFVLYKSGC